MATHNDQWESSYFVSLNGTAQANPVVRHHVNPLFKVGALITGYPRPRTTTPNSCATTTCPASPLEGPARVTGEGLPVLVDNESDFTIWQTKLPTPNANNQPPGVYAGEDKFVGPEPGRPPSVGRCCPTPRVGWPGDQRCGPQLSGRWGRRDFSAMRRPRTSTAPFSHAGESTGSDSPPPRPAPTP